MKVTIPYGFKIGHYQDNFTGVTVFLAKNGAIGGCDCRGGAPGTRETDLLRNDKMMQKINAVVLSGGSAYGLASTCGVMEYLKDQGIGYKSMGKIVPIVCGAVLYDLNQKEYHYPTAQYGLYACKNADKTPDFGNIGAGRGATVGKIRGLKNACKSGIGAATVKVAGVTITAVVAVNAMGDVVDESGKIVAGAKGKNGNFIDTEKCLANGEFAKLLLGTTPRSVVFSPMRNSPKWTQTGLQAYPMTAWQEPFAPCIQSMTATRCLHGKRHKTRCEHHDFGVRNGGGNSPSNRQRRERKLQV